MYGRISNKKATWHMVDGFLPLTPTLHINVLCIYIDHILYTICINNKCLLFWGNEFRKAKGISALANYGSESSLNVT